MSEFIIGRRELYILPTRHGWYYAMILLALFGIAMKFNNQAAFMMLFILMAVGLVAMLYTHNNVINLRLSSHPAKPVFAGETAYFPVSVKNPSNAERSAVWLLSGGFQQLAKLDGGGQQTIDVKLPSLQRGYLNCEPINLTSQFPIGIFFCWSKRYISAERCLVYPQPLDLVPFSDNASNQGKQEQQSHVKQGSEDYAGMKNYQAGDRLRDIHWPSLAKTNKLVSIQYETHGNSSQNISWFSLPATLSVDDKLGQLCFWLLNAEQDGRGYQLEMPSHTIEFDSGYAHLHACLRVLALWGIDDETAEQNAVA